MYDQYRLAKDPHHGIAALEGASIGAPIGALLGASAGVVGPRSDRANRMATGALGGTVLGGVTGATSGFGWSMHDKRNMYNLQRAMGNSKKAREFVLNHRGRRKRRSSKKSTRRSRRRSRR